MAVVGTIIVVLNIALVICLIRRKRSKRSEDGRIPMLTSFDQHFVYSVFGILRLIIEPCIYQIICTSSLFLINLSNKKSNRNYIY